MGAQHAAEQSMDCASTPEMSAVQIESVPLRPFCVAKTWPQISGLFGKRRSSREAVYLVWVHLGCGGGLAGAGQGSKRPRPPPIPTP